MPGTTSWRGSGPPSGGGSAWGGPSATAPSTYRPSAQASQPSTAASQPSVYQGNTSQAPQLGTAGGGPAGGGGLLGPVFNGLGQLGLDPGQGNQQLAAGLNNIAQQAQQSGNQQLNYMQGALGASEQYYDPAIGQYNQLFAPGGSLTSQGVGEQAFGGMGSSILGTNPIQAYQANTLSQFQQPGAMEQFANSTLSGTNPYYQMMSQLGGQQIDQEFDAGGNYNSGARLAAQAKFQGDLGAQTFNNEANIMGQGQAAQQARLAGGGSLAGMSASSGQQAYNDYLNQALAAQSQGQGRQLAGLAGAMGLGDSQSGLASGMYTNANNAYAQMLNGAFGAEAQAYAAQSQAQKDRQSGIMSGLSILGGL